MKLFELPSDAELTREAIREFGNSLTWKERIKFKIYGLGNLRFKEGNQLLTNLYDEENNTIKTHFDWTTRGAIIRMRTMKKVYALGISDQEIKTIMLRKQKDDVYTIPFSPFWILMKMGVRPSVARWFSIRPEYFIQGPAQIEIDLIDEERLVYEAHGDQWSDCLSTFRIARLTKKINVTDQRRIAKDFIQKQSSL